MDLRSGIISTAEALGIDPLDLATVISYETAGTFDPAKAGPTTQWGQHRGLIQFGEPQARQHGVDWNDPIGSQLGPDGAVASYMRASGVRPGMGLLDVYSAVNAGAPGLYNRTDANNGGAPGTVRDKVENQMSPHRQKAAALLNQDIADDAMAVLGLPPMSSGQRAPAGGTEPRSTISTRGPEPMAEYQPEKASGLLGMLFPNMTADRQDRLVMGLSGMAMNPNQGLQSAAMGRMDERRGRRAQFEQDRKQQEQVNKTTAYIENQVRAGNLPPELLEMARVDPMGALRASQDIILRQPERPGPRTQIAKLQADLNDGLISREQYEMALQALAQKDGMSLSVGPDGQVSFTTGGAEMKPLTEGQSKDTTYATRARGALPLLNKYDVELSQIGERALDADPTGLLRGRLQSPEYQMAKQAGDEFLQAILRKDTGAAITADEQTLYGTTYLPQPGDGPDVIEQKRQARARALAALEAGMPPAAIIQQEKALSQSGSANSRGGAVDFSNMSAEDLSRVDVMSLSPEQLQALQKRFDELGL